VVVGLRTVPLPRVARGALTAQDLLHRLAFCQLVDELVQPADLLHQRVVDLFHANAADHALDQRRVGVQGRRLMEEGLEVALPLDLLLQALLVVARQPADDLVDLFLRAVLALRLLDVQRVDLGEGAWRRSGVRACPFACLDSKARCLAAQHH